jgi:hypothetical protein
VFFSGSIDSVTPGVADVLHGTLDPNNWTLSGTQAFTLPLSDVNGNHVSSSAHSVALDSAGNAFLAATVVTTTGDHLPGIEEVDTGGNASLLAAFASVGPNGFMDDITDGMNGGDETIYASGTLVAAAGNPDSIIVAAYDEATQTIGGGNLGVSGENDDGFGIGFDPAGDVYVNVNYYAVGSTAAHAEWVAFDSSVTHVLDGNLSIHGSHDDRSYGLVLYNGEIYQAGATNSPDMSYLAPSSPAFGGTPGGQYDGVWYAYNYTP